jgi:threonine dehydrogenase-like Zn-dependent dehydrogenase
VSRVLRASGDRALALHRRAAQGIATIFEVLELVRPRGTLVLKSTFHGAPTVNTARIVIDEVCVLGSRCGPFAPAARALAAGRVDPRPLIDATYPLRDAVAAFAHAQRPGVLKVLIDPRA